MTPCANPLTRRGRPRAREGFTLIEVMLALAILGIGLLGLAVMQLHAMRGGTSGRHTTQAAVIARDRMEVLHRVDWSDAALSDTAGAWSAPATVSHVVQATPADAVEQVYSLSARVTDRTPVLKEIAVRVTWNEPNRPNRSLVVSSVRFQD